MRDKFWLATQDSFDYSSFITAGMLAGLADAKQSTPQFGHGGAAYGRYYWHAVTDQAVGNYMTEAILPTLTREDPRSYTLGHGGFFRRSRYAFSRPGRTGLSPVVLYWSEIIARSGICFILCAAWLSSLRWKQVRSTQASSVSPKSNVSNPVRFGQFVQIPASGTSVSSCPR
jgi:hypothetical protein